jgi:hypothetical protein
MLRTLTTLLLSIIGTISWGQITETRNSLLTQLIDEIKLEGKDYKQVTIGGHILWDTSEFVYKKYFTIFDTTDQTDLAVMHRPTRRRIVAFSKMVTSDDYYSFRAQISNQRLDSFKISNKINGAKKSNEKMTVSFSQPLVTVDRRVVVIKEYRRYSSGGHSKLTIVYIWRNGNWTVWDYLERESLAI